MNDCPEALDTVRKLLDENNLSCNDLSFSKKEGNELCIEAQVSCNSDFNVFDFIKRAKDEEIILAVYNS